MTNIPQPTSEIALASNGFSAIAIAVGYVPFGYTQWQRKLR